MADFSQGRLEQGAVSGPNTTVGAATSGVGAETALNTAANLVSIFTRGQGTSNSAAINRARSDQENAVSGQLASELTKLADARQSGQMTAAEANARGRAALRQFVSQDQQNSRALVGTFNSIMGGTVGGAIAQGSEAEQHEKRLFAAAVDAHYVDPQAPKDMQMAQFENWQKRQQDDEAIRIEMQEIQRLTARNQQISSTNAAEKSTLELEISNKQNALRTRLDGAFVDSAIPRGNRLHAIANNPSLDVGAKVQEIQFLKDQELAELSNLITSLPQGERSAYLDTASRQFDVYLNGLVNEQGLAAMKNKFEAQRVADQSIFMQNPAFRTLAAADRSIPNSIANLATQALVPEFGAFLDMSANFQEYDPATVFAVEVTGEPGSQSGEGGKTALEITKQTNRDAMGDSPDQMVTTQMLHRNNSILKGVTEFNSAGDPRKNKELVNYLADGATGEAIIQNYDEFLNNAGPALDVLSNSFNQRVRPLIDDEIKDALSYGIRLEFGTQGVTFVGGENFRRKQELNTSIAPVINKHLRAMSHLAGTKEYRQIWDKAVGQEVLATQNRIENRRIKNILFTKPNIQEGDVVGGWQFMGGEKEDLKNYKRVGKVGTPMQEADDPLLDAFNPADFDFNPTGN